MECSWGYGGGGGGGARGGPLGSLTIVLQNRKNKYFSFLSCFFLFSSACAVSWLLYDSGVKGLNFSWYFACVGSGLSTCLFLSCSSTRGPLKQITSFKVDVECVSDVTIKKMLASFTIETGDGEDKAPSFDLNKAFL